MSDLDRAIQRIHHQLDQIRKVPKCTSCECLLDVMEAVQRDLSEVETPKAQKARRDLQRWIEEGKRDRHACLGCEVCLPIQPYNRFNEQLHQGEASVAESPIPKTTASACGCGSECGIAPSLEKKSDWPPVEGDYLVGNPVASVALCTLADTDLPKEVQAAGLLDRIAIVGSLSTENLGIERVIRNVVTNPSIRYLVLCGRDSRGHRAGQALLSLQANGVDEKRRIIGAQGPRPVLKNVTDEEINRFRQQVTVVDEIDSRELQRLEEVIQACQSQPKGAELSLPPKVQQPKVIKARRQSNREWVHDPEGFFLVLLDRKSQEIVCEHYTKEGVLNEVIRGRRASHIANTAIQRGLLSRLDHAAYLGQELAKAETSLALGLPYTQDLPLKGGETT